MAVIRAKNFNIITMKICVPNMQQNLYQATDHILLKNYNFLVLYQVTTLDRTISNVELCPTP